MISPPSKIKFLLEHKDKNNKTHTHHEEIYYFQFIKHLAFAGFQFHQSIFHAIRFISYYFEFLNYTKSEDAFFLPDTIRYDQTEVGQISNKIGKAFADYAAKKIYGASHTTTYENAMQLNGLQIKGNRPDLYCIIENCNKKLQFSVEAKGYSCSNISHNKMIKHKGQAGSGPLPVNFYVASVAYNLYGKDPKKPITVKFHDPDNDGVEYNKSLNNKIIMAYYTNLKHTIELLELNGLIKKQPSKEINKNKYSYFSVCCPSSKRKLSIIINSEIIDNLEEFILSKHYQEQEKKQIHGINYFIDSDQIGIEYS